MGFCNCVIINEKPIRGVIGKHQKFKFSSKTHISPLVDPPLCDSSMQACKQLPLFVFSFQIKVSVSSGGDCLRSYRPDIRKGRYNTITLHVKTTTPDNLLFYLGSAKFVSSSLKY